MYIAIPLILIALALILLYNGLINKKNRLKNAESTIDVMYKKRHDLIPSLIETVKEYMNYESSTLTEITKLREGLTSSENVSQSERIKMEDQLSKRMGELQISFENYPDLKASENFVHLQRSLNEIEEQLSAARRAYNGAVLDYNNGLEMFPSNIMAGWMKLEAAEFYDIPEEVKTKPDVKGLFNS